MSKADLKDKQLPVTDSKPYVCEPIPKQQFPDMLPVLDPLGGFLFWASEDLARALIKKRQARVLGRTKNKIRALQAFEHIDNLPPDKTCSQKRFFGMPNRRETEQNPPRVWTQYQMGHGNDKRARWCRKVCAAVVTSCIEKKAA